MRQHLLLSSLASRLVILLVPFALSVSHSRAADVTSTLVGTGLWTDNSVWSSPLFPDNGNGGLTYDALIGGNAVTLNQDITIESLNLSGGVLPWYGQYTDGQRSV